MNFGTYIHKVFEDGVAYKDSDNLLRISENIRNEYNISSSYEKDTKKCINNFIEKIQTKIEGETIATELRGEIILDKEHDINYVFVIDRIIKGANGGYLVIDYKTSKREKNKFTLYKDKQLKGYTYAVAELFDVPFSKITCAHFYPQTGNLVCVQYKNGDIQHWKAKEIEKVWRIRKMPAGSFCPSQNDFCDFCEFQKACKLHSSPDEVKAQILLEESRLAARKDDI